MLNRPRECPGETILEIIATFRKEHPNLDEELLDGMVLLS